MALQAFADDSMEDGRVLVLAGYVSSAERWSSFSDEWQQRLGMRSPLERFKMSEMALSEERMSRVPHFYRVIEQHAIASVAVAVDCRQLAEWVPRMSVPQFLVNPYYLAHKALLNVTAQHQRELGITDKIDFVFDRRVGEERRLSGGLAHYMETLPDEFAEVSGAVPIFRSDDNFLPLQAADLLAWWTRKTWLEHGSITRYPTFPWQMQQPVPAIVLDLSGDELMGELRNIEDGRRPPPVAIRVSFHGLKKTND
jgi:hypothetical protein